MNCHKKSHNAPIVPGGREGRPYILPPNGPIGNVGAALAAARLLLILHCTVQVVEKLLRYCDFFVKNL